MRLCKVGIGVLALLLCASQVQAQLDFNIKGSGARSAGVGGAYISLAEDATAVQWNPAGLTILERAELSAVGRYVQDAKELDDNVSHGLFQFGSAALPFTLGERKVVLAGAYQRQLDFYDQVTVNSGSTKKVDDYRGGADSYTAGLSLQLTPVISVGAGANIWFGTNSAKLSAQEIEIKAKWSGVNALLGAVIDLSNKKRNKLPMKIGFVARTPFTLEDAIVSNPKDPDDSFEMPWMLGFGVAFRFSEFLRAALDYEARLFDSRLKSGSIYREDLNQLRVGLEYLWITDMAIIPLRGGLFTIPRFGFQAGDFGSRTGYGFALGTGWIGELFSLDLAYSLQPTTIRNTRNVLSLSTTIYLGR